MCTFVCVCVCAARTARLSAATFLLPGGPERWKVHTVSLQIDELSSGREMIYLFRGAKLHLRSFIRTWGIYRRFGISEARFLLAHPVHPGMGMYARRNQRQRARNFSLEPLAALRREFCECCLSLLAEGTTSPRRVDACRRSVSVGKLSSRCELNNRACEKPNACAYRILVISNAAS